MNTTRTPRKRTIGSRAAVRGLFPMLLLFLCLAAGCPLSLLPCGLTLKSFIIRARVTDAASGVGLTGASLGGLLFTAGDATSFRDPLGPHGEDELLLPNSQGRFDLTFFAPELGEMCGLPPFDRTIYDPEFPPPDQIELIVIRDGCEQRFMIDVNEDTVVDMTFPDDIIELKDPILVPPCVE